MNIKKTIQTTIEKGLCCSCGICAGVCVKGCITMSLKKGVLLPILAEDTCIGCGICYDVCPGKDASCEAPDERWESATGHVDAAFVGRAKDNDLLKASASGGICTWLVATLLERQIYDCAFCVDSFNYSDYLKSKMYKRLKVHNAGGGRDRRFSLRRCVA